MESYVQTSKSKFDEKNYSKFFVPKTPLTKGMILPSRSSEGLFLEIDSFNNPILLGFYNKAQDYIKKEFDKNFDFVKMDQYNNEQLKIIVQKLVGFVREYFKVHNTPSGIHTLSEMMEAHTGECKVMAASLQILLQTMQDKILSWYVKGNVIDNKSESKSEDGHAWVEVSIGSKTYRADPALNTFSRKEVEIIAGRYIYKEMFFPVLVPKR